MVRLRIIMRSHSDTNRFVILFFPKSCVKNYTFDNPNAKEMNQNQFYIPLLKINNSWKHSMYRYIFLLTHFPEKCHLICYRCMLCSMHYILVTKKEENTKSQVKKIVTVNQWPESIWFMFVYKSLLHYIRQFCPTIVYYAKLAKYV